MKLTSLKSLHTLNNLKPLTKRNKPNRNKYLSELEMIMYSSNLCYFAHRLFYDEVTVKNKSVVMNNLNNELYRLNKILSLKDNWYSLDTALTKKEQKENFKRFGITKRSLNIKN
ncbi:hypothetical protein ACOTVT_10120 [Aliarcobacter butzleri]